MKASELNENDWFTRPPNTQRFFERLSGDIVVVDDVECVPVKIRPFSRGADFCYNNVGSK